MKRITYIYFAILVLLGGLAIFLLMQNREGTIPVALKDFAVRDTGSITKIFLADRSGNKTLLERKAAGSWLVNGKYKVNKDRIDMLLETIRLVEVKNPVPVRARQNYLKEMLLGSTKVEIYKNNENAPAKVYTVGGTTPDLMGTIMLMQGSSDPFVTWIPGFNGFLSGRYFTAEKDWRTREIFAITPSSIREVEIMYPAHPEMSFIFKTDGNNFTVSPQNHPEKTSEVKPALAKSFLVGFGFTEFENFYKAKPGQADSILASRPLLTIKVKTDSKEMPVLSLYSIIAEGSSAMYGRDPVDHTRFLGSLSNSPKEIFIAQVIALDKILKDYRDFAK